MTTINPNSGGFFTGGPSGSTPGVDTQDLYVVSGVVSGENLVLTLSNQTTVTITLESVFTNGELTGLNYNESTGVLTVNQGSRSFSTTIDVSGDALSTASIVYDAPTSTLIFTETDGDTVETFTVPFPTIIEDVYDADGNQLLVTTVGGRTRVTLPQYITQDSLDVQLLSKEDRIDAILVDVINPNSAEIALFSEDEAGEAVRTDNDQPLVIGTTGGLTLSTTEGHQTGGLGFDLVIDASEKQDKIDAILADANDQQVIDGVVEVGFYKDIDGNPVPEHTQPFLIKGTGGISVNLGAAHEDSGLNFEIEVDGSGIEVPEVEFTAYSATQSYSRGDIVYVISGGVSHFYLYVSNVPSTGMDPEDPFNNLHWHALGVNEVIAVQEGASVEIHLARADSLLLNPNAGMAVEVQNDNVGHSDLLNWEAENGVLILNVDGLVDALADGGSGGTVDTALRDTPDDVANDTAWLAYINSLGISGGVPTFVNTAAWEAQEHITLDIEFYISTNDSYDPTTANTDLAAQGYSDGDEFFIVSRDTTYQVISTGGNLALQFILTNRDSLSTLDGGQSVLDDISDNAAAIEANTQHNHEQDARIAALENQDFTTTISSFTESTTLSNLFTSGTIINKGNAGNNLYQAWTVTREGHELIGYLQLTDTERDTFRNEFSLVQGSSSNIYIPANPDAPHTIGIKAFPAADFNDLSSSTQVMLGQISSMRFGGSVGSETMFEIRWELINYSDAIDTGLGTVDSGEIYGSAGDKRYAFLAPTIYTAPAWEFREATVSRTEIISGGADNALRDAPDSVADDTAWLAYINNLGITGGGSTVRVDGVEVDDPNFIDNNISTTTARGVAFGADGQGNIIAQVDVTGLSGMGESALSGNTVGSLVKVNATQDGFDDAVEGVDYQDPLFAGTDYQTPLTSGVDYLAPDGTITTAQVTNLDTMLAALGVIDQANIGLFVNGQAYRIGDNFVEANTLYRVLSAGAYASFNAIIAANAAQAIGTFTINQTNNTFTSVTFTATVTNDAGVSVNLSNISYDTPTTTLTVEGTQTTGGGLPTADFERTSGAYDGSGSVTPNPSVNWSLRVGQGYSGTGSQNVNVGTLTDLVGRWIGTGDANSETDFPAINFILIQTAAGNITLGVSQHSVQSSDQNWRIDTVTSDLTTSSNGDWENVLWGFYVDEPVATETTTTSSLNVNVGTAARSAVAGTAINLSATSTVNDSVIITQELVDTAVGTGDFVIVDNVLQVNNGITSPGFISFVRINGFLGVRQEASDTTRDIYIVSYRGANHTVYFFKADSTWRSSDSTADNTNVLTPLIGG